MRRSREDIEAELAKRSEAVEALRAELNALDSTTLVRCEKNNNGDGCGQGFEIRELEYIQTHWYVEPRGCTGGDYWREGEGNWSCPKCGHRNRLYNKPDIVALRRLFRNSVDEHEH